MSAHPKPPAPAAWQYPFTRAEFDRIAEIAKAECGLHLPRDKVDLVYARLARRLRSLQLEGFSQYCDLLESAQGLQERQALIGALTTNVTRFMREPHQFEHFSARVAPGLIARARAGAPVRLWSAGCASGEEAYSLAVTLLDAFPDAPRHDVKILASDIDASSLATARAALYSAEALAPFERAQRDRWFEPASDGRWRVGRDVQALVRVRALNLIAPWPMRRPFDVIMCRNVAIYFDANLQARLWSRFVDALAPQGRLYVGHAERVDLDQLLADGPMTYRKTGGAS